MCELTFSDLGKLNVPFFVQQSIINALANNHDGIGYMQEGKTWKSKMSGARIDTLGILAKGAITEAPLAFHTRFATNKLLNEDCHSHPFKGDKIILMHNGKLEMKDDTLIPVDKVDSQVFTEQMEAAIVETPDIPMVDLMQTIMDKWCGKFAFMIYDSRDSEYYVIRGATADLHWTTINDKLVVNTQKLDLAKGIHHTRQLSQLIYDEDLEVGKIEALDINTIYRFHPEDSKLMGVGELKENKAPLASSTMWVRDRTYGAAYDTGIGTVASIRTARREPIFIRMKRWLDFHNLSLQDLNVLSNVIMGCSLLELNDDDLRCFYAECLRTLSEHTLTESLNLWSDVTRQGFASWAYLKPDFKFPWMLNGNLHIADMSYAVDVEVDLRKKEREERAIQTT